MVICLQVLSAALAQRRAADQQQCALFELGNVMERVAARRWTELTTAALVQEKLSSAAANQLPGAELKIEVVPGAGEPNAKLSPPRCVGKTAAAGSGCRCRVTTWRYKILD